MTAPRRPTQLIVGTDLTTADHHTADVAHAVAAALDAPMLLVHAMDTGIDDAPPRGEPTGAFHAALEARIAERRADVQRGLDQERARLSNAGRNSDAHVRAVVHDGRPWEIMQRLAAAAEGAWIVVGGRRRRAVLGRTSDHVLRHTEAPVLVVPDAPIDVAGGGVLVAVDGSALSGHALAAGQVLARALGRSVTVFHARSVADVHAGDRIVEEMHAVAPGIADAAPIDVGVVVTTVAHAIAEHARSVGASFVVVGSHGRHGIARLLLGSTAQDLAHASPVPLLVVR